MATKTISRYPQRERLLMSLRRASPSLAMCMIGLALWALIYARFQGWPGIDFLLSGIRPLVWVGGIAAIAGARDESRGSKALWWLLAVICLGAITNVVLPLIRAGEMNLQWLIPTINPAGVDFRNGIYTPGKAFSSAASNYPPLTLVVGWLFSRLEVTTAYFVQLAFLFAFALGSVVLTADLASHVAVGAGAGDERARVRDRLCLLLGLWLATSYGLYFELERGQSDLYALFFSLLSLWLVLKDSRSPWLPALSLAIAVNLKVYPAILGIVLLWKYKGKAVVPLVSTNLALLFLAGPFNALEFVRNLNRTGHAPPLFPGLQSAAGFVFTLSESFGLKAAWLPGFALMLPLGIWAITIYLLIRSGWSDSSALMAAAASFPPMGTVPSLSADYKLVLAIAPLGVLMAVIHRSPRLPVSLRNVLFAGVALELVMLSRSYALVFPSALANKYSWLVGLQLLVLILTIAAYRGNRAAFVDRS